MSEAKEKSKKKNTASKTKSTGRKVQPSSARPRKSNTVSKKSSSKNPNSRAKAVKIILEGKPDATEVIVKKTSDKPKTIKTNTQANAKTAEKVEAGKAEPKVEKIVVAEKALEPKDTAKEHKENKFSDTSNSAKVEIKTSAKSTETKVEKAEPGKKEPQTEKIAVAVEPAKVKPVEKVAAEHATEPAKVKPAEKIAAEHATEPAKMKPAEKIIVRPAGNAKVVDIVNGDIPANVSAGPADKAPESVKTTTQPEKQPAQSTAIAQPATLSTRRIIDDIRPEPTKKPSTANPKTIEEPAIKTKTEPTKTHRSKHNRRTSGRSHTGLKRFLLIIACSIAAIFAIVYFVNLSTPSVELRLAQIQTGIERNAYPNYIPRGYSLSSFTAETGKIMLYFENRDTDESFTLSAENSSWDSNSLYANFVKGNYSDNYAVIKEQGLTLYVDSSKACWVNGGVLYKINVTSGTLTKKQIKAIAVSL